MNPENHKELALPERLSRLKDLAYNLWWSWHHEARFLFRDIDPILWESSSHNPVLLLYRSTEKLSRLAKDPRFLAHYDQVVDAFDHDTSCSDTWFERRFGKEAKNRAVAYFSAEFGLHASLPLYSGGLGVLAGDHLKSASDLDLPLVGVGFMYPKGYVTQRLGPDGWQQNIYHDLNWDYAPILPLCRPNGERVIFDFSFGSWQLKIAVWLVHIGRVSLYLMDTNVEGNSPSDREITTQLYGGDHSMRLRQEIVLGVGGLRLLRFLGIPATFFHANEGHAAFLFVELLREKIAAGLSLEDAKNETAQETLFTTHTPVPAGHDVFEAQLLMPFFQDYLKELKLSQEQFLDLGHSPNEAGWNMTALALKLAGKKNAVSKRHGQVSQEMWHKLWPEKPLHEVPIDYITNVLILSSFEDESHVMEAIQAGANGYLSKMLPSYELVNALKAFANKNVMIPQPVMSRLMDSLRKANNTAVDSQLVALTRMEVKILALLGRGQSNKEIAHKLELSVKTVKNHLNNMFQKLGVTNRTEAVVKGIDLGIISAEKENDGA